MSFLAGNCRSLPEGCWSISGESLWFAGFSPRHCRRPRFTLGHQAEREMPKVRPNGEKIAELRKSGGFKQFDFAKSVGMSERKLREIETRNLLTEKYQLKEIAE